MKLPSVLSDVWRTRKTAVLLASVALVASLGFGWTLLGSARRSNHELVLYSLGKADLPIVVTERGNLESQLETDIRCEVESYGYDRNGVSGTQIIYIVPNGKAVTKGELLVELDSAPIREKLDEETLEWQAAEAERIQANAQYENQHSQNATAEAAARLDVELAELELKMYDDGDSGTYRLALEEIDLKVEEANNAILEAQAALELEKTNRVGIERLFELGYRGKGDLDQSRFKFLQAEDKLAAATNNLKTALASRRKLEDYEYKMEKLTLQGSVDTFKRKLKQVQTDNISLLAQAKAAKDAADQSAAKELERVEKYRAQLEKCKIYAPHDGMAVYATESSRYSTSTIGEGAVVRERQRILTLPNLALMQVKTAVHESVLDQVQVGLPVTVKLDAFPDRTYRGTVHSVAVLPEQGGWSSSDAKVYETIVRIDEEVQSLKPGMTAVVDVHIERLEGVLAVPVQAIVQKGAANWCYVADGGGVERRPIEIGRTNDKFVQIRSGLSEGEQIVLNPMAIVEHDDTAAPQTPAPAESELEADATEIAHTGESDETQDAAPVARPAIIDAVALRPAESGDAASAEIAEP